MNIEDYRFGRIVVNGRAYTSDVIVFPDRVKEVVSLKPRRSSAMGNWLFDR